MTLADLRRPVIMKLVLVLCLVLGLLWGMIEAVQRHRAAQASLDEIAPRHARLLGLIEKGGDIQAADQALQEAMAPWTYPADRDASQTGNAAQQRVRDLLAQAGLDVMSSQVLPAQETPFFDRIPLVFRVSGEPVALHSALAVLSGAKPAVLLDNWSVQNAVSVRGDAPPRLAVELRLTVLRSRP